MSERCEWAETIGQGTHADMVQRGISSCCDVGFIDWAGRPLTGQALDWFRDALAFERATAVDADFAAGWQELVEWKLSL